jgi:DNA polymerase-3 subunit delta'
MQDDAPSRPDQVPGAPHPSATPQLFGQAAAEAAFLSAWTAGRRHHAWLMTGPRGVGKATLAYRIASFLLCRVDGNDGLFAPSDAAESLETPPEHPVAIRMAAGSEPGLRVVTRTTVERTGRLRAEIVVEDIRRLADFFHLTRADGGQRVVILDAADEMTPSAANALLKMLEEPPAATTLLLVAHQPARLLPTIRSRCRTLRLSPLGAEDMARALAQAGAETGAEATALAALSGGSVGTALRHLAGGGLELYAQIVALLATLPRLDRVKARALAEQAAGRGAADRFDLLIELLELALARLARTGAGTPPDPQATREEARVFARLAPDQAAARAWAEAAQTATTRLRHGQAVNLDPAALVLDTLLKLEPVADPVETV